MKKVFVLFASVFFVFYLIGTPVNTDTGVNFGIRQAVADDIEDLEDELDEIEEDLEDELDEIEEDLEDELDEIEDSD